MNDQLIGTALNRERRFKHLTEWRWEWERIHSRLVDAEDCICTYSEYRNMAGHVLQRHIEDPDRNCPVHWYLTARWW